jgi:hypothetical protein
MPDGNAAGAGAASSQASLSGKIALYVGCSPSVALEGYQTCTGIVRDGSPPGGVYVVSSTRCPQLNCPGSVTVQVSGTGTGAAASAPAGAASDDAWHPAHPSAASAASAANTVEMGERGALLNNMSLRVPASYATGPRIDAEYRRCAPRRRQQAPRSAQGDQRTVGAGGEYPAGLSGIRLGRCPVANEKKAINAGRGSVRRWLGPRGPP